jgi:3-phosphoglycerate kinase
VLDHVFIGGVMVNMFASSVVDHVFIGGVMVNHFSPIFILYMPPMSDEPLALLLVVSV